MPLLAFEGTAYDCGRAYGEIVQQRYPRYEVYLKQAPAWRHLTPAVAKLFERRAPCVPEIFRGLEDSVSQNAEAAMAQSLDGAGNGKASPDAASGSAGRDGCTSFGVSGSVTLEGNPISGQTKDVQATVVPLYIVLRMRLKDGPTILVLAYPGEVLGLGLWSTGMSVFRNSLYSTASAEGELTMPQWGLLALAGSSVPEALELAERHGIAGQGSLLIGDGGGESCSVEFNGGGVSPV